MNTYDTIEELTKRLKNSPDRQDKMAAVVLSTLHGALLENTVQRLADLCALFSLGIIHDHSYQEWIEKG